MRGRTVGTRAIRATVLAALMGSGTLAAQERMPPIAADKMNDAQRKSATAYSAVRKTPPGGPFAVMLRVPELMDLTFQWREHVQFRNVLDQRQAELVILIAARHWTQQYVWNSHEPPALKAGLKPEIVSAIKDGRRPEHMAEDETILYDLSTELLQNRSVSDPTYARALAKFGEPGIVEATSTAGYYSLLAMVMNTARTPVPAGAKPPLTPFPK
jgi:4-carboxymuconolactone decarboxylase